MERVDPDQGGRGSEALPPSPHDCEASALQITASAQSHFTADPRLYEWPGARSERTLPTSMAIYDFYRLLYERLPRPIVRALGRSRLIEPIRNGILRPAGRNSLASRELRFGSVRFDFTASYKMLAHAEVHGIESSMCRLLQSCVAPGILALDVGANYGYITCVLARSGARVIAYECDDDIASVLRQNAGRVGATAVHASVGDGRNRTVRLDDLLNDPVSIVKIDTDGSELAVLDGARGLLSRDRPVVVVEANGRHLEVVELLSSVGYSYFGGVKGEPYMTAPNIVAAMTRVIAPPRFALADAPVATL